MKRPAATENNLQRIKAWREICPDITLRSTFIVGFPDETEAEFEELLDFLSAFLIKAIVQIHLVCTQIRLLIYLFVMAIM